MIIQFSYRVPQHTGNFQAALVVDVVDFIADTPDKDRRMIAVLTNPAGDIFFPPFIKVVAIVVVGFTAFPHIETFREEEKPHFVAEFQ